MQFHIESDLRFHFIQCLHELLHRICCQFVLIISLFDVNESNTIPLFKLHFALCAAHAHTSRSCAMAEKCSKRCVIDKLGPCVVVRLVSENKENRLNPEFLQEYNKALDQVER